MYKISGFINNIWKLMKCSLKCVIEFPNRKKLLWPKLEENDLLIVGNGPSTAEFPLDKIAIEEKIDFCVVNHFPLKDERFWKIKPKYIALVDPVYYKENSGDLKDDIRAMCEILEKIDWDFYIISRLGQRLPIENERIQYIHLTNNVYDGIYGRYFFYRKNLACFAPQNVVLAGLFFAINNKINNVYLIGVEMDSFKKFTVTKGNDIVLEDDHSYGKKEVIFSRNTFDFTGYLGAIYNTFRQFCIADGYAKKMGVNVINLTQNSMLYMFEKK